MIITQETIISFDIPEECADAEKFEKNNPDWIKDETSLYIMFRQKESVYSIREG